MEAVGKWRHVQGLLQREQWSRSARLALLAWSVTCGCGSFGKRAVVLGTRHPQPPQHHASNHSAVDSVPQWHPRLSRAFNTRRYLHRLSQSRKSDIRDPSRLGRQFRPARGPVAALSIADLFRPADQSVIHNVYGTPTKLRYPDSACICNIDISVTAACATVVQALYTNACTPFVRTAYSLRSQKA
jgi:hypothetical protein